MELMQEPEAGAKGFKALYHKFEAWAKKHPYMAGVSIAVVVGGLYYILSKISSSSASDSATTAATKTTSSTTPSTSTTYTTPSYSTPSTTGTYATGTNSSGYSMAELEQYTAEQKAALSNQIASAREQITQAALTSQTAQSNAGNSSSVVGQLLNALSSGSFNKAIDSFLGGKTGTTTTGAVGLDALSSVKIPGQSGAGATSLADILKGDTSFTGNTAEIKLPDTTVSSTLNNGLPNADTVKNNTDYNDYYSPQVTNMQTSPNTPSYDYNSLPTVTNPDDETYYQNLPTVSNPNDDYSSYEGVSSQPFSFDWEAPTESYNYDSYDFSNDWSGYEW